MNKTGKIPAPLTRTAAAGEAADNNHAPRMTSGHILPGFWQSRCITGDSVEFGGVKSEKTGITVFLIFLAVAAAGCITNTHGAGSGNVINQTRSIQGVDQVSLDGTGTVLVIQGNQESLTIEAEDTTLFLIS
ncbi:MAG: hypothetical protein M0C28_17220 [Candidatus Moduliflexus flocculans]|nr:hypothetical protein [Candidatus Moduliflexus flocculans]